MASIRQDRIAELLRNELNIIFQREARTLCMGAMVTVTVVRISQDLSIAKVFVSIFGHKEKEKVFENLKANAKLVRRDLGNVVGKQIRKVPELHFYMDDSLDYAEEIDQLLKK